MYALGIRLPRLFKPHSEIIRVGLLLPVFVLSESRTWRRIRENTCPSPLLQIYFRRSRESELSTTSKTTQRWWAGKVGGRCTTAHRRTRVDRRNDRRSSQPFSFHSCGEYAPASQDVWQMPSDRERSSAAPIPNTNDKQFCRPRFPISACAYG